MTGGSSIHAVIPAPFMLSTSAHAPASTTADVETTTNKNVHERTHYLSTLWDSSLMKGE